MRETIVVTRGDTRELDRQLFMQGLPIDLEQASVTFTVDGLFSKTLGNGIELVSDSGDSGYIVITIDPADTEGCPDWRTAYRYDVEVEDTGIVTTPLSGRFVVVPDVTA